MLLSGLHFSLARSLNALMKPQTYPQGEEGIKGEKGMRGLWGQVVIYHTQNYNFVYPEMLQICINDMLC